LVITPLGGSNWQVDIFIVLWMYRVDEGKFVFSGKVKALLQTVSKKKGVGLRKN